MYKILCLQNRDCEKWCWRTAEWSTTWLCPLSLYQVDVRARLLHVLLLHFVTTIVNFLFSRSLSLMQTPLRRYLVVEHRVGASIKEGLGDRASVLASLPIGQTFSGEARFPISFRPRINWVRCKTRGSRERGFLFCLICGGKRQG